MQVPKAHLRMELKTVDVPVLVGDTGDQRPRGGRRLESVGDLVDAVAVGQQHGLLLGHAPDGKTSAPTYSCFSIYSFRDMHTDMLKASTNIYLTQTQ